MKRDARAWFKKLNRRGELKLVKIKKAGPTEELTGGITGGAIGGVPGGSKGPDAIQPVFVTVDNRYGGRWRYKLGFRYARRSKGGWRLFSTPLKRDLKQLRKAKRRPETPAPPRRQVAVEWLRGHLPAHWFSIESARAGGAPKLSWEKSPFGPEPVYRVPVEVTIAREGKEWQCRVPVRIAYEGGKADGTGWFCDDGKRCSYWTHCPADMLSESGLR